MTDWSQFQDKVRIELEGLGHLMENMVNLPSIGDEWYDSGEGGLAFYFLIPENGRLECNVAGVFWGDQDVVVYPRNLKEFGLAAGVLIGSTPQSLASHRSGYFHPTLEDLTSKGTYLFRTLEWAYRETPIIVTLLDT